MKPSIIDANNSAVCEFSKKFDFVNKPCLQCWCNQRWMNGFERDLPAYQLLPGPLETNERIVSGSPVSRSRAIAAIASSRGKVASSSAIASTRSQVPSSGNFISHVSVATSSNIFLSRTRALFSSRSTVFSLTLLKRAISATEYPA
jgi:hypothetical protein